jgi:hypothetical protein
MYAMFQDLGCLIAYHGTQRFTKYFVKFDKRKWYFSVKFDTMDLRAEKLGILHTIMRTDDEGLIMDIKAFLSDRKADWFDELSVEQQNDVLEGLLEADNDETVPHAEAVKLFGKWGLK